MAEIKPFRGLRYTASAGSLDNLTAPPYDVISPAFREQLAARSPHNVVNATLPEQKPDDRSKFVKYARSAALLASWRQEGIMGLESAPAFYRYTQTFNLRGFAQPLERTSIIALIKVEPYEKGVVLPHEQTFPKHKEDRLRILEATRAHLECIFGLFEDPQSEVLNAIKGAKSEGFVETTSDDHVHQRLEPIVDPEVVAKISALMADKKVWIADGHHRYETALTFRQALGPKDGPVAEDYMMMALSSISDPGLVLMPTHRIVSRLPISPADLIERAREYFDVREVHNSALMNTLEAEKAQGHQAFGVALKGSQGFVLVSKDEAALADMVGGSGGPALKALDVSVLHAVILEKLAGLQGLDAIAYTRDELEAVHAADAGADAAFLMNPPTVDDMRTISLGGDKMPQKSTYYFPKILSGLVLWSLNDF